MGSFRVVRYKCTDNKRDELIVVADDYLILDYEQGLVQFFTLSPIKHENVRVLWAVEDVERIQPKEQVN